MHVAIAGDYPLSQDTITGGVEAVVLYLTQELSKEPDVQLSVVTLDRSGGSTRTVDLGRLSIHTLQASQLPSRLYGWQNVNLIHERLLRLKPDLVHVHAANEYAQAAAKSGLPWVLTIHGIRHLEAGLQPGLINRYREWFVRRDEDQIVRNADNIILISPYVGSTFAEQIEGRTYHIDNPVSEAFFRASPTPESKRMLYVGRLIPTKDIMTLLQALDLLRLQVPDVRLFLAGKADGAQDLGGDYFRELEGFVAEAGLKSQVSFLGQLDEATLLGEYARAAVVVLPSVVETSPMAIMQAMAAAKPVVCTNTGGARHLVEDGVTGFLVPVGDSSAMAEALRKLLVDNSLALEMGRQACKVAEDRFRADRIAQRTIDVYHEILANDQRI